MLCDLIVTVIICVHHIFSLLVKDICVHKFNVFVFATDMISKSCQKELSKPESTLAEMMPGAVTIKGFVYSLIVEIEGRLLTHG